MFLRTKQPTELEINISNFFALYKDDIIKLHGYQWNQEDIKGQSRVQFTIFKYYIALYYVILIWLEYNDGLETDWEYYKSKYDIACKKKTLACFNISLDKILAIFGLPPVDGSFGIQGMGIEKNFIIEPSDTDSSSATVVDIQTLLNVTEACYNYMNTVCETVPDDNDNDIPTITPPPVGATPFPIYWGTSNLSSLTEAEVLALNTRSETSLSGQLFSYSAGNYKYIAIPTALGIPTSILDNATQLNMVMQPPYLLTIGVQSYNVYRSTNILGGNIVIKLV